MSAPVGAIDIGTNSVRLLITNARGDQLLRRMQITRLGEDVDVARALIEPAIERTCRVLAEYGANLRAHGVDRVRMTATSAARDASNRAAFFDRAAAAVGTRPELLSGEQEAQLSFGGATAGLDAALGPFLIVDIGGGSTEFVLGQKAPDALISTDMGCVRMSERFLTQDPPTPSQLQRCLAGIDALLGDVAAHIDVASAKTMLGLAGTVTTLGALVAGLERYDPSVTHGMRLTRADVEGWFERLAGADVAQRRRWLLEPRRAEVIVGGMAVLVQILRRFGIDALQVSESDILDGLAASLRDGTS